ncbi:putative ribonuclease H-like domain-containing protein [Tanacetum coccineum]
MFTVGASHTLKATHVEFFSNEDEPGVDLGNILNSYTVSTSPNTRIHKDHPIKNVIGDVKSFVQTRRMTKPTSEQGFNPQVLLKLYLILGGSNVGRTSAIQTPTGFKDPDHPDKVYKVVKVLYGLHQAPGACSTNKELCIAFEKLIKDKFQMSSMGELTFFLGLQSASTPVDMEKPLVKDGDANDVDVYLYRSMTGSLIYLKGKLTLGLWYSRDSSFKLVAYTDSNYARATQDRNKECMKGHLTSDKSIKHIGKSNEVRTLRYLSLVVPLKKVGDEAVHKELGDRMEKAATTASNLEAEQDRGALN